MHQHVSVRILCFSMMILGSVLAGLSVGQDTAVQQAAETAKAFEAKVLGRTAQTPEELLVGGGDFEAARDTLQKQIRDQIDGHREAERRAAATAREELQGLLIQTEGSVKKATTALDRWDSEVRPCLLNESGARIANDERLLSSFMAVFNEFDPQLSLARAELAEAQSFCSDIRQLLQQHSTRHSRFRPSSRLSNRVQKHRIMADDWEEAYSVGVTKIELWTTAAVNKMPSVVTLEQALLGQKEDLRPVHEVGKDLLRIRTMAFLLAAKKFANKLTEEAIMRSNIAQVEKLGVMTGRVAYARSTKEKAVTLQVTKHDANNFEGRLLFDDEGTLWEMQGNLRNQNELFLKANAPQESEMAFKGTLQNQRVSGRWFYPGKIGYRGTFLFQLAE